MSALLGAGIGLLVGAGGGFAFGARIPAVRAGEAAIALAVIGGIVGALLGAVLGWLVF